MHFADLGAEVILVERPGDEQYQSARSIHRGKRSIVLDFKNTGDVDTLKKLIATADGLFEGMRPGVMERLDLGPDVCLALNPKLVFGRLTGWGQDGSLAHTAGHDINYASLSGAAWYSGEADGLPLPPPTLVGDIAGGAHYLVIGMLAALLKARETGKGDVIDAAMVDGGAHMMNLMLALQGTGLTEAERGRSILDGPHWYTMYRCADDRIISIGPLELPFYSLFLEKLGLADNPAFENQFDKEKWPELRDKLASVFVSKPASEWCELFEGTDVCFAPVLSPWEAAEHPHLVERQTYIDEGGVVSARAAPRFESSGVQDVASSPEKGADTEEILKELSRRRA